MSDFSSGLDYIGATSNEADRLAAVRKLTNACETACELLSVSVHIISMIWSESAEREIETIMRERALEITELEVTA